MHDIPGHRVYHCSGTRAGHTVGSVYSQALPVWPATVLPPALGFPAQREKLS